MRPNSLLVLYLRLLSVSRETLGRAGGGRSGGGRESVHSGVYGFIRFHFM